MEIQRPNGKYSDQVGAQTQSGVDNIICKKCGIGKYSDDVKRTSEGQCKACPNGRYSDIEGVTADTNCKVCTIGKWSNVGGLVTDDDCKLCPLGRQGKNAGLISDSAGDAAIACQACGVGKFTSSAGLTECVVCAFGRYIALGISTRGAARTPTTCSLISRLFLTI